MSHKTSQKPALADLSIELHNLIDQPVNRVTRTHKPIKTTVDQVSQHDQLCPKVKQNVRKLVDATQPNLYAPINWVTQPDGHRRLSFVTRLMIDYSYKKGFFQHENHRGFIIFYRSTSIWSKPKSVLPYFNIKKWFLSLKIQFQTSKLPNQACSFVHLETN